MIKEMVAYILQLTVLFPVLEDFMSLSMGLIAMLWFHFAWAVVKVTSTRGQGLS